MDTKWRNSKFLSFPAAAAAVAAAVAFMSLFPFFSRRAQEHYIDPLTQQTFIDNLLSVNYVQYKYLKEKADQRQYGYADLFLSCEAEEPTDVSSQIIPPGFDEYVQEKNALLAASMVYYEDMLAFLGGKMDYYAQDLETGETLTNSGSSLPDAVDQPESGGGEYVYYLSMEYDNAGNLRNIEVLCEGSSKQFINQVQTAGHEHLSILSAPENIHYYQEEQDMDSNGEPTDWPSLQISFQAPSNMRVIYGLTQGQYASLLQSDIPGFSDLADASPYYAKQESYYQSGSIQIYLLFLAVCFLSGLLLTHMRDRAEREENRTGGTGMYTGTSSDPVRRIYIELLVLAGSLLAAFDLTLSRFIFEYQNGIFLRNVRAGLYGNGRFLFFFSLDKSVMFLLLFVLFYLAFLVGRGFSGLNRRNLKQRSFLCKYWDRIKSRLRRLVSRFYTDLVSYDIGTDANRIICKVLAVNFVILLIINSFWFAGIIGLMVYTVVVYFMLKKYVMGIQEKYRRLLGATSSIAQGNLDTALSEDFGVFESYKSQLRQIQDDFKRAVEEEVKSQRMKSELITNVSHDLKTPLTAIITYIDLLKEPGVTKKMQQEYLDILQKKADRLKVLIEDLFEVSRASSRTVSLQIVDVDICNLLRQACLELEDRITAADLDFKFQMPDGKLLLPLDSQKTYRIFDNLYTNIIKYALPGTRVYIILTEKPDHVEVVLKNISSSELRMDPSELTERFVRGDGSRNTEGSGLGLAIAKSFAELQGGSMHISIDGDLFKVLLTFPKKERGPSKTTEDHVPGQSAAAAAGFPPPPPFQKGRPYQSSSGRPSLRQWRSNRKEKP